MLRAVLIVKARSKQRRAAGVERHNHSPFHTLWFFSFSNSSFSLDPRLSDITDSHDSSEAASFHLHPLASSSPPLGYLVRTLEKLVKFSLREKVFDRLETFGLCGLLLT